LFSSLYSGNAIQTLTSNDPIKVITVRGTAFEAASTSGGSGSSEPGLQLSFLDISTLVAVVSLDLYFLLEDKYLFLIY